MTGLLYSREYPVCDGIVFKMHTLGEILDFGETEYYEAISVFMSTPSDYMWPLAEQGIDFEEISDYDLFCSLKGGLSEATVQFLFGDTLPLHRMMPYQHAETGDIVLLDPENPEIQFNSRSLVILASLLKKLHFMKHERIRPGNAEAKSYMLERARRKYQRARRKGNNRESILEPLIVALVCAPEFPYNYESCRSVTIYQFMSSVQKIPKRLSWNFVMHGVHVGMIDAKGIDWHELDWLSAQDQ